MINKNGKKSQLKYINDFPVIIAIVVLVIMIIFAIMYFSIKPYKIIYKNGYMVLSNYMTYNLVNNNVAEEKVLDVGVAPVSNGDYIYKQLDTYYVGLEKKQEIDYAYPVYSADGLTIYNLNDDAVLIDRNFEKLKGYSGLSLSYGILYNEDDSQPADDIDYLFLYLNNSIHVNAQTMVIKTSMNAYTIPMHSPIYFDSKYINYYIFDGEKFKHNTITDIYEDSVIEIGGITLSYNEFLVQMGLIELNEFFDKDESIDNNVDNDIIKPEDFEEEVEDGYIKPTVSVSNFISNVYSISAEIYTDDPSRLITSSPMFEIYTMEDKLYSRKKGLSSGAINLTGLSANTEYKIIGTYKYKNKNGVSVVATFYEGTITTNDIGALGEIQLSSELGSIYSDKIEIKDLTILDKEIEAVSGVKKVELNIWEENNETDVKTVNLSYDQIRNLIKGEKVTVVSKNDLNSNTVYEYSIKFYDKDNNQLKVSGNDSGTIKTSKAEPYINISSNIDEEKNIVSVKIETQNKDDLYIKDYKYQLYSYDGTLVEEDYLNYEDGKVFKHDFIDLYYNTNYILKVTGMYDLEDGKGEQKLNIEKDFSTVTLDSNFVAWYDGNTLEVTDHSITADVYIGLDTFVLEKDTTEVIVYLTDENGKDILDENGELKFFQKYTKDEYYNSRGNSYYMKSLFENIDSNTEYNLKIKINVNQLEKVLTLEKQLMPTITTEKEDAYLRVINKKLVGDNLDVTLQVSDVDNLINPNGVIVEIYEGKFNSPDEINGKYVYRNIYNVSEYSTISINLFDYTADDYTIIVSSNPYNNINVKKVLYIEDLLGTKPQVINVDRKIDAKLEMYEQRKINNSTYETEIRLEYNLYETESNVYLVDCVYEGMCDILGYFDSNNQLQVTSDRYLDFNIESVSKRIFSFKNTIDQNSDNDQHVFYLIVEKGGSDLTQVSQFEQRLVENNLYTLASLDYNTGYEIYNIDSADDFFDTNLIKTSNETRHYVVTENLNFYNKITQEARFNYFQGTIDFQGYSVELYLNTEEKMNLFSRVYPKGVLKNMVLNYHLQHVGVLTDIKGFVYINYGTMENMVINVEQENENGRIKRLNLLSGSNYGHINNFVIYLNSDIHLYNASTLGIWDNNADGRVTNGYVSTNPILSEQKRILLYENSGSHGTIAYNNYGTVENVYSLVDAISVNNSAKYEIGTIAKNTRINSTLRNTISVATTTQSSSLSGPNLYNTQGLANINNNYYFDTNINNLAYGGVFSTKIDKAALINKGFWNMVINQDNAFSITTGYYPILKMSDFMSGKQTLIPVSFDYFDESKIDVLSIETISGNIDNADDKAQIKVYISNPQKFKISHIDISEMTTKIKSIEYDESSQSSIVTLELSLNEEGFAKSTYYLNSVTYLDSFGEAHIKNYNVDNNSRIVNVEMYRKVNLYDDLITAINKDENIFLKENIEVLDSDFKLPNDNEKYTSIFDGNHKTINFNNQNISRGYFIYRNSGTIKNLQIKNMKIESDSNRIGFVRNASGGIFLDIDISDSLIISNDNSNKSVIVGNLISYSSNSSIVEKASINNLTIEKTGNYNTHYIGGIVGSLNTSNINNSYVYNLNINNMTNANPEGTYAVGGIIGYSKESIVQNCYSIGKIDTEYFNVGGISGNIYKTTVKNNYSYMQISSKGNYVGGISGNLDLNDTTNAAITNNMFIGKLVNVYDRDTYSLISPVNSTIIKNNYALVTEQKFTTVLETNDLMEFDKNLNKAFDIDENKMPYLKNSSFVEQKIKDTEFINLNVSRVNYELFYESTNQNSCVENISDDLYSASCADYAVIRFLNPDDTTATNYEITSVEGEQLIATKEEDGIYKLEPNKYLNYYVIKVKDIITGEEYFIDLDLKFYKKIKDQEDWNSISDQEPENIILLNDITLDSGAELNKKIINFLGNNYKISTTEGTNYNNELINHIFVLMTNVTFSNVKTSNSGLIHYNSGKIKDCKFYDIEINSQNNYAAIVINSSGYIRDVELKNINVIGKNYVGALVARNQDAFYNKIHIEGVEADNLTINGNNYVGGIVGEVHYTLKSIKVNNVTIGDPNNSNIYPKKNVGGIVGNGDCGSICEISNSQIYAGGSYVGGIGGGKPYAYAGTSNIKIDNLTISNAIASNGTPIKSEYVGGVYGSMYYINTIQVDNLVIANINTNSEGEQVYTPFNGNYIGGVIGTNGVTGTSIRVDNSYISGNNHVGGIFGNGINGALRNNVVFNSVIKGNGTYAGGLIGHYRTDLASGDSSIDRNVILSSTVYCNKNCGGIIGTLNNNNLASQTFKFYHNIAIDVNLSGKEKTGGVVGYIDQVPSSETQNIFKNLFYGVTNNSSNPLIGGIGKLTTGASGYGEVNSVEDFINKSDFKEYVGNVNNLEDYQINSVTAMKDVAPTYYFEYTTNNNGYYYFPILKVSTGYMLIKEEERVLVPYDSDTGIEQPVMLMSTFARSRMLANYSNSYNNSINLEYDVYASDVDKINIEFSNTDSNIFFYYEIEDYKSDFIPITERTYTLSYDFKKPIKIYISNGYNYKESTVSVSDLAKTISIIDGKTYYITNKSLYSENKMIVGEFVNLYNDEALTVDGKIYNIVNKEEYDSNIDYNILEQSIPLYENIYKDKTIKTYYNYSTVNDVIKDFQLFVKNGNLTSISSSLDNIKDMYIFDFYNNNEIQIILKNNGKLYSIKNNIKYPSDIVNKGITEIYTNINSTDSVVVLKYENGAVYTFDYRTGDLLFDNTSEEYYSFLDYVKKKISGSSQYNEIENISSHDKYSEIELLKVKINNVSLDEATDKIYGTNNTLVNNDNYVTVYNEMTKSYDLYKVTSLLNDTVEIDSETDRLYKNYELVQFYKTLGSSKKKNSISGIILFTVSIISVLVTLTLLIGNKINKKGDVL